MSALISNDPVVSFDEQIAESNHTIRQVLGLSTLTPAESKRLSSVLSIACAEMMLVEETFVQRIKQLYEESTPKKATRLPKKTASQSIEEDDLVPVATGIDYKFDPLAPPDPHFLLKLYGREQLYKALDRFKTPRLKETITKLAKKDPNLKIKSKVTKDDIIDLIIKQVLS